jgi:hypothetical protein
VVLLRGGCRDMLQVINLAPLRRTSRKLLLAKWQDETAGWHGPLQRDETSLSCWCQRRAARWTSGRLDRQGEASQMALPLSA